MKTTPEESLSNYPNAILVDTSSPKVISASIDPKQVVEVIDHRQLNLADEFPNAKLQIELVGAAATLIAEKFYQDNIEISPEAATLLYAAICSNTINFQAKVTTNRDLEMAEWLKTKINIPSDFIHQMFVTKSDFNKPLREVLREERAIWEIDKLRVCMFQLEMVDVDNFLQKNLPEIKKIIEETRKEENLDYLALTCIDIDKGRNTLWTEDLDFQKILEKVLGVKFEDNFAQTTQVWMRKEIVPKIKTLIEEKPQQ